MFRKFMPGKKKSGLSVSPSCLFSSPKVKLAVGITGVIFLILLSGFLIYNYGKQHTGEDIQQENSSQTEDEKNKNNKNNKQNAEELQPIDPGMPALAAPEYTPSIPDVPEIQQQECLMIVEAELAAYSGSLYVDTTLAEYSGTGYLSAFQPGDEIRASFMIPVPQHYDITVTACADTPVTNRLLLNGACIGEFTVTEQAHFTEITFPGIYLPAGVAELSVEAIDGNVCMDAFQIANHTELYEMHEKYQKHVRSSKDKHTILCDADASPNAVKLMQFLNENYGKSIISGQYVSGEANTELLEIYETTGNYPAIRFDDLQDFTREDTQTHGDVIASCEKWAAMGGIVGLIWHWDAPAACSSVYAEQTDFSLADAVPAGSVQEDGTAVQYQTDVALLTEAEITAYLADNRISESCAALLRDIDCIADALQPLAEQDIPVLWRPLHEAGGGWFWWGADGSQSYRWLWDILYRRMTTYHQLHNLIWIWNGQSACYLVKENQYDIASVDVYTEPETDACSHYALFLSLYRITKGKKLIAMSECSTYPDMQLSFRDNTIWSFCGLWYGAYTAAPYTDEQSRTAFYHSAAVLTLRDTQGIFQNHSE